MILSLFFAFKNKFSEFFFLSAKDFIRRLLVLDPTQRYTARNALSHPFIVDNCGSIERNEAENAIRPQTSRGNAPIASGSGIKYQGSSSKAPGAAYSNLAPGVQNNLMRGQSVKSGLKVYNIHPIFVFKILYQGCADTSSIL